MPFQKFISTIVLFISILSLSSLAFASGGYGGGGYRTAPAPKAVDRIYEYGKAIYSGRVKAVGKIRYCVANGEEKVKLKRKSLKTYKKTSYNKLKSNLYNCDMPEQLISQKIGEQNMQYVLYYLNKRYKLKLS